MKHIFGTIAVLAATMIVNIGTPALAQTTSEIAKGNCTAAAQACEKSITYCNSKKGKLGQVTTINALKDCIDACRATEQFLGRGSSLSGKSAAIAVAACNEAAKVCDQYKGDTAMIRCANEVRKASSNLDKVK